MNMKNRIAWGILVLAMSIVSGLLIARVVSEWIRLLT